MPDEVLVVVKFRVKKQDVFAFQTELKETIDDFVLPDKDVTLEGEITTEEIV